MIAEKGRVAWQKAVGYGRSRIETAIGRYKHIIGQKLRARSSDGRRGETAIAVQILNRMTRDAKPSPPAAPEPNHRLATILNLSPIRAPTPDPGL